MAPNPVIFWILRLSTHNSVQTDRQTYRPTDRQTDRYSLAAMEIEPAPERVHDAAGTATAAAAADAPPAPEMNDAGAAWKPTKRFLLAFMSLQVIVAAVAIESTSLPAALPVLSSELGGTALEAFWAGTSYLLASTVIQPTVASMSHILGRRIVGAFSP